MTPPSDPTSWAEAAEELGVPIRSASEHLDRWLAALGTAGSTIGAYSIHGGPGSEVDGAPLADTLDAAVGLAHELEQWQRLWFGPGWRARLKERKALPDALRLDRKPPPGVPAEHWEAIVRVMEADPATWEEAAEAMPKAVALLGRLERSDSAAYVRLRDAALGRGEEIDRRVRPPVLGELTDLERGVEIRGIWRLVFGPEAGVRPAVPRHVVVHILEGAGLSVRPTGLFLAHVGLSHARLEGAESQIGDRLEGLDNEVRNALKSWRSLKAAGQADAWWLVEFVEGVTATRQRTREYGESPISGE